MKIGFEGIFEKPKGKDRMWGAGVPLLEIYTQGRTRKEALEMVKSAVEEAIDKKGFAVHVEVTSRDSFALTAQEFGELIALMLRQKRDLSQKSLREISKKLGSKSPNAYHRYELGTTGPTLAKIAELMEAVSEEKYLLLKVG